MGALPNVYPGYQPVADAAVRRSSPPPGGRAAPHEARSHLPRHAGGGSRRADPLHGRPGRESRVTDPAQHEVARALEELDCLVVVEIFLTETAKLADVVLPAAASRKRTGRSPRPNAGCSACGKALTPPGEARDDSRSSTRSPGAWAPTSAAHAREDIWNEMRALTPMYAGMTYARLDDRRHPVALLGPRASRRPVPPRYACWDDVVEQRAPFMPVKHSPPVDLLNDDYPLRLTTGRSLESFNTGVQTGGFDSPLHEAAKRCSSLPRTASATGSSTAVARSSRRDAARSKRRSRSRRICAPVSPS